MTDHKRWVYRHWIIANTWAEAAGLGTTFVLGATFAPYMDRLDSAAAVLLGALGVVLHGTLLEGILVGFAQSRVIRHQLRSLSSRAWTFATAAGAGLAWLVGMIPSTAYALTEQGGEGPVSEPGPFVTYAAAVVLGAVTGPILAVAQWTVLRHHVTRAHRWLLANAVAWAVGMPLIFIGMDQVPWAGHPIAIVTTVYLICALAGCAVGIVHGRWLISFEPRAH